MYLEQVEIQGFRGINRLAVPLQQTTALIGENAWGKTSLLRALWSLLGQGEVPYQFEADDFYRSECPETDSSSACRSLQILLIFREYRSDMCMHSERLSRLAPVWSRGRDGIHRIYYRARGLITAEGEVRSLHDFLRPDGSEILLDDVYPMIHLLMLMNPVLRLRDARSARCDDGQFSEEWENQLTQVSQQLLDEETYGMDTARLRQSMTAVSQLMEHYLSQVPPLHPRPRTAREIVSKPVSLRGLGSLQELLSSNHSRVLQLTMAGLGGALLAARGDRIIEAGSRPILILEDPESRLHPTLLALVWGLFEQLPGQKILTTNSGDLLTAVPLHQILRLVRRAAETRAFRLHDERLSAEELRRIAFHVRINRPMSLFARCWLLVEGETELWLLSELANICGYSLQGEGVRVIEFAQCGELPLIKAAQDLGIEWHLLADGDEAGTKYINGARHQLKGESERERLTLLPARDIEHFLFHHGFADIYRHEAGITGQQNMPPGKIIERAINRLSKPGLALAVVEAAEKGGKERIPSLLQQMFATVVALARRQG